MTTKGVNQVRTKLEAQYQNVFRDLVAGKTTTEIAQKYHCTTSAVSYFKKRNLEALDRAMKASISYASEPAIAEKGWRIAEAQRQYDEVDNWEREHGLTERTVRYDRDGNEIGETIRFRKDLVDAKVQLRKSVAEELGQLPKNGDTTINNLQVLIRQYNGQVEEI